MASAVITSFSSGVIKPWRSGTADSLGGTSVQVFSGPGRLFHFNCVNNNTSTIFLKFYDKNGSVNQASDNPIMTVPIAAAPGGVLLRTLEFPIPFANGCAVCVVANFDDLDATAPASSPVLELHCGQ